MWLLLRLLTSLGIYLWRFFWRKQDYDDLDSYQGVTCARKIVTNKNQFQKAYHGMEYSGPLRFQFTREKGWDRYFKDLGLAVEQQTGDRKFDEDIYITCDQAALGEMLRTNHTVRAVVLLLFDSGVERIFSDGAFIWAEFHREAYTVGSIHELLHDLRTGLLGISATKPSSALDQFFWRAVAVESLAWSIALYGVPGFAQFMIERNTLYLDAWALISAGLLASLAVFAVLFATIVGLLRGSSRGHRIIVESFLVLLPGIPLSTVQAVSDLNIALDDTTPMVMESMVYDKRVEVKRSRRRTTTYYYLHLQAATTGPNSVNGSIEVEPSIYYAAQKGRPVTLTMRQGKLGYPWLETIAPH